MNRGALLIIDEKMRLMFALYNPGMFVNRPVVLLDASAFQF